MSASDESINRWYEIYEGELDRAKVEILERCLKKSAWLTQVAIKISKAYSWTDVTNVEEEMEKVKKREFHPF